MSGKARKRTKKQALTRQQQQTAAARRRMPITPGARQAGEDHAAGHKPVDLSAQGIPVTPLVIRHYLDVSAVRIQDWLARTPTLKFRRGASVLLSEATGRDAWLDGRLPARVQWNSEAGDLDGVVSLVADDGLADAEAVAVLSAAARAVTISLRDTMPHCPIQAVLGTGDSYASAYEHMSLARRQGSFVCDAPAPPTETILAKPCDECRAAPAVVESGIEWGGREKQDLCGECCARFDAGGGTKGDRPKQSPRPERRMKSALEAVGMAVEGFPDDFRQMAESGVQEKDDAATQIALIYADGNRVGAFLSVAANYARTHTTPAKEDIVRALDGSTLAALADAVITCFPGSDRPPVLAHVAGGDDLVVSVPAGAAWLLTRTLMTAFSTRISQALSWPPSVRDLLPSLSAGLVFHHLTAPFPDVVRLAKDQLIAAKRQTAGQAASVAFLDLTADGGNAPGRSPLELTDLDDRAALLDQVALIPRSHRETIVALHRLSFESVGESRESRAETPVEALARRVVDLGYQPLWDAAVKKGATASEVRTALESEPASREELRRILDLARWWPKPADAAPGLQAPAGQEIRV